MKSDSVFDQPVILEQPAIWSQVFVWLIVGVTASGLIWAAVANVEQAIPATGKLEPKEAPKEIKAPVGGVVREVLVDDGDFVKQGEILLTFDPTSPEADVESLRNLKESLIRENQFYSSVDGTKPSGKGSDLESLTKLRENLITQNQYYQALVNEPDGSVGGSGAFDATQERLLGASRAEYQSRVQAARLQVQELEKQLSQTQGQLSAAQERLASARQQIPKAQIQLATAQRRIETLQQQKAKSEEVLELNRQILSQVSPLVEEGALSKLQRQRQEQEVLTRQAAVLSGESDLLTSLNDIETRQRELLTSQDEITARQAEVNRLSDEAQRIAVQIERAKQELQNTQELSRKDVLTKISDNEKQIAEIDSQLGKSKLENQKTMARIEGELTKAQQALQYQELRAPVSGYVFDLKASSGSVARETDQEPILKLIPNDKLIANVFIQNKDIALVKEGMPVDINIEAFPAMEFGTIEGKLLSIGKDALPPTQERPFYSFPAKIELDRQYFEVSDKQIPIQSGMAVQATVKIGKRTVLEMFLDRMSRKVKTLETVK
ncbi:HlyD family efflux transporter periplasmic adaptor subunit [Microcoleus sp. FACHB-68]|uniref:HlyD family efflux transporter periplasmic adaptor subunit n=1 Tax=Microcoleus sp. FACHB-68 TaxID=2692826 RepID=UPI001689D7E7|nr:HlyD family efflux transporter periplasmic adaptor subunit [Microcoleus sp. FACHB-68]